MKRISVREVQYEEDFLFIAQLCEENRTSFDASGEPTEFELFRDCTIDKYRQTLRKQKWSAWIGRIGPEPAGFLLLRHGINHPALPGKLDSAVYGCAIARNFRGYGLIPIFHELAVTLWKASGDYRLIAYTLADGRVGKLLKRYGFRTSRTEYEYVPRETQPIEFMEGLG